MRTNKDRIRHAVAFEVIGLILSIGIINQMGFDLGHVSAMGLFFSVVATLWNYIYNIGFDHLMIRFFNSLNKTALIRVFHSIGFELGLLIVTIPGIAWVLDLGLWETLILDIGMIVFYLLYGYIYNLAYDKMFPVPVTR